MYILFGTKWAKLFCGPMWSYVPIMQVADARQPVPSTNPMNPVNVRYTVYAYDFVFGSRLQACNCIEGILILSNMKALVNVPGLSERTLRRQIERSNFSAGPEIQVCTLHLMGYLYN